MNIEVLLALLAAVTQLAPQIPEVIAGVETAIRLAQSNTAPTAEEQATIDAAFEAAHAAFQAAATPQEPVPTQS